MTTTLTAHPLANPGRRIQFTFYRELGRDDATPHPGVITALVPNQGASVKLRLDGHRSNLHVPPDYQGLTYLDEIGPVPELPMGRFQPTPNDLEGWDWQGIQVFSIGEDGEVLALTGDLAKAVEAINAYRKDMAGCLYNPAFDTVTTDDLVHRWAYFDWQPEDAESPWFVHWTHEGDDQATELHHFPT